MASLSSYTTPLPTVHWRSWLPSQQNNIRYFVNDHTNETAGDLYIADSTDLQDEHLPKRAPKLLIEVLSPYNYVGEGAAELEEKLTAAFENGTECVWLVHTGTQPNKLGIEVITPEQRYSPDISPSPLPDAGLNLGLSSQTIFE